MKPLLRAAIALGAGLTVSLASASSFDYVDGVREIALSGIQGPNSPLLSTPGPFSDRIVYTPPVDADGYMLTHVWQDSDIQPTTGAMSGQSGISFGPGKKLPFDDSDNFSAASSFIAVFSLSDAANFTFGWNYDASLIAGNRDSSYLYVSFIRTDASTPPLINQYNDILATGQESFLQSGHLDAGEYRIIVNGGFRTDRYSSVFDSPPGGSLSYDFQFNVTPVPEPETWALLLAGLGLMGVFARRRSVA